MQSSNIFFISITKIDVFEKAPNTNYIGHPFKQINPNNLIEVRAFCVRVRRKEPRFSAIQHGPDSKHSLFIGIKLIFYIL